MALRWDGIEVNSRKAEARRLGGVLTDGTLELYVLESVLLGFLKRTSLRLGLLVIIIIVCMSVNWSLLAHYFPISFGGNPYDANDSTSHFSII